ncbi:MAG: hypothetical protein F9K13_11235 [Candidatus Methylomirabilis oxygeniifera]|uniref:Uncharacterized protein n=1 Tax=Methylomirabilis oxygeniifera TaxID=671143 RepID=D5MGV6_METO1|nr:MAG: hypothetical protein F9K13_11235 [Candidatus Methylomirabilis oxyfera]CBE68987.1 protein of unknown function [Candidatus Methylomirabilis oxyfera]
MMSEALFSGWLSEPHMITILFTWFVQGVFCYSMFVLPHKQEREAMKAEKPAPVEESRKAAWGTGAAASSA